jgi:8-oxo-dGTP pyrophosphatase MutT (NUDIX family)
MERFPERLKNELKRGLPGTDVQWQMASSGRLIRNFPRVPGKDAKSASVLILLYPQDGSVYTVFMQRPEYDGIHSGQISFPGGKKEESDDDAVDTALREAHEETGVDPSTITVIGILTPLFIPVSNMLVTPVVAWSEEKPEFRHHPDEVVFLFDADLNSFLDSSMIKYRPLYIGGETIEIKYFYYKGHVIWGATSMILNELLVIIKRSGLALRV